MPESRLRIAPGYLDPKLVERIRSGLFPRDAVSQLAHIFGRLADWGRNLGNPYSLTAIEREEEQKRQFRIKYGIDYDKWIRGQR